MDDSNTNRLSQIDALRGLAALVTLAFHYTTRYDQLFIHTSPLAVSAALGQKGVFLFFAISGFVIFMTLDRAREPMDFVVSRFSRLYPVYWASVLFTAAVLAFADVPGFRFSAGQVLANLTMVHGFFRLRDLDGVYWSLQVELLFYLWALGLWLVGAVRRPVGLCIAWSALALAANLWDASTRWPFPGTLRIFLLLDFIPFFVLGIVAYVSLRDRRLDRPHVAALGLAVLAVAAAGDTLMTAVAVASGGLIFAGSRGRLKPLDHRVLLFLGAISYPLYLTHQVMGQLVILHLENAGVAPWLAIAVATATAIAVASALHFAIEMPAMRAIRARYRRRRQAQAPHGRRTLPWLAGSGTALAALAAAFFVTGRLDRGAVGAPRGASPQPFQVALAPQLAPAQRVAKPILVIASAPEGAKARLGDLLANRGALERTLREVAVPDYSSAAVLLQVGEADALAGTAASTFQEELVTLRERLDRAGMNGPLIVARTTYCSGRESGPLRRAVEKAAASRAGIYVGPDIDQLGGSVRRDDCALNDTGTRGPWSFGARACARSPSGR